MECIICGSTFPSEVFQCLHFFVCFEAHCPAAEVLPIVSQPREYVTQGVQLGAFRIPAGAIECLFTEALCPPARVELAQASRGLRSVVADTWAHCPRLLWPEFWKHTQVGLPHEGCGSVFSPTASTSPYGDMINALRLWRVQTLNTNINIVVKTFTHKRRFTLYAESGPNASRVPMLLRTSVKDVEMMIADTEGWPVNSSGLTNHTLCFGGMQLLHRHAPLAACVWKGGIGSGVYDRRVTQRIGMIETLEFDAIFKIDDRVRDELAI